MSCIHLYLDEAGNFDFGPNGTRWLVLTCVSLQWDCQRIAQIAELRHDLLLEGIALEYFHASEDNRRVRQRFFKTIGPMLMPRSVRACVIEKHQVPEDLRPPERFYPTYATPLVHAQVGGQPDKVFAFSDVLPLNKKRRGLEKAVAEELSGRSTGVGTHAFFHHASKSNFDLQVADYCCWAVWRAIARSDEDPLRTLGEAVIIDRI